MGDELVEASSSPPARSRTRPERVDLESLVGAIDGIVLALDPATYAVRYVSQRAVDLLGFREDEWLRDPRFFVEHLDPAERSAMEALLCTVAGGAPRNVVHRFAATAGPSRWFRTHLRPSRDASGRVTELAALMVDITAGRAVEEALLAGEQHLRLVFDRIPAMIWTTDRELRLTSGTASPRVLAALGLGPRTLSGVSIRECLQTDDPNHPLLAQHRRALAGETGSLELAWHGRSYSIVVEPLRDGSGAVIGTIAAALDVTERRTLDAQLQQQNRRLAALADASADLARSRLDPHALSEAIARRVAGTIGDLCFIRLVGDDGRFELAAVHHRDPARASCARDLFARFHGPVVEGGGPNLGALLVPRLDERTAERIVPELRERVREFHSLLVVPMRAGDRTIGVIAALRDETAEPYSEADVALAEDLAERASQALETARLYASSQEAVRVRDEFLSVASHELRTPVTTLLLRIQRAMRDPTKCDAAALAALEHTALRLATLLDELVDVSRLRLGRLTLDRERGDLARIAREVVERTREEAARVGCDLELRTSGDTRGAFDKPRLEQVLSEMLSNAMKFGAGRPIDVEVRGDDGEVCLCVRDRGVGVAPADRQRIFERFERAVSSQHFGGLGLGLYVARHIVEAHGGSIRVEPPDGPGARFVVTLPR